MQYRIRNPLSMTIFEAKPFRKHGTAWKGKEKKTGILVSRIGIINILIIIWVNSHHLRISNPSGYLTCFSQQENPACRKKWFLVLHFCGSACISLPVPAARQGRHPRSWSGSSVRLERQPVTLEVVSSSLIRVAICLCSSVGRARDWKSLCRRFDSTRRHHFTILWIVKNAGVAQW